MPEGAYSAAERKELLTGKIKQEVFGDFRVAAFKPKKNAPKNRFVAKKSQQDLIF